MDLDALRQAALDAAARAGEVLLSGFGRAGAVRTKSSATDLLTEYDGRAQEAVLDVLAARFPEHAVLSEEGVDRRSDSPYRWVVDPLDGTTNFAHANPFFCVSIALERDGEPILGVVQAPVLGETFVAARGGGATLNGKPIGVSAIGTLSESLLATGFPYQRERMARALELFGRFAHQAQGIRRNGAAALDLCWLAAGRLDGFWEFNLQPWDVAAGALAVEEARGRVSDFAGHKPDLGRGEIVASNGRVHGAMIEVIGSSA